MSVRTQPGHIELTRTPRLVGGQHPGQRVERRLRDPVGRPPAVHVAELAGAAGDVDDPRRRAGFAQQRQHRLDQAPGAEDVGLQDLVRGVEVEVGDALGAPVDAGVVDQRVEPAGVRLNLLAEPRRRSPDR